MSKIQAMENTPEITSEVVNGIIRLKPQQFIHVLDNNTGVTRLEVGPQTITLRDHERLILKPSPMIVVPPRYYCIVSNPVLRDETGQPIADQYGQIQLRYGDREIRLDQPPFPLYPGEILEQKVTQLQVVETNYALRLKAIRDFTETVTINGDSQTIQRVAGDEWLFEGPGTYIPRVEVEVLKTVSAIVIKPNQALRLMARKNCIDRLGNRRRAGEEWLVREEGAYLPGVDEELIGIFDAYVLTERKALHLRAKRTFTDIFGRNRKAGDEWLVTIEQAEIHIPDVYEEVVGEVEITTLSDREWCIVVDPIDSQGKPQLGMREVRQGRASFFLHPGESLEDGIQTVYVLGEQEALLLRATEAFSEGSGDNIIHHQPGDLWMIPGPRDYIPLVEVEVIEKRQAIPLDKNEGIYVRNIQTGELKLVSGPQAYMLSPYEELWEKELPPIVEELLAIKNDPVSERGRYRGKKSENGENDFGFSQRDKTRAVVFHVPQNAAVQIHDYKERTARTVFGPELVMLGPDEAFTVLSLSGSVPKRPHVIKSLALLLGPDFMTDLFTVETSDHARLQLRLSYNWYFEVDKNNQDAAAKLFQAPDFVDTACKAIASRVRGAVAGVPFDEFHRNSARIIRQAVFGIDDQGHIRDELRFKTNNLVIFNVDIQSVEPVDEETLKSLQKSVQIAIQITTDAQEAAARHDAARIEQEAEARLERQQIIDKAAAEVERKNLLALEAENAAIESTGQAIAEARAKAEAAQIEGQLAVSLAQQEAQAAQIRDEVELAQLKARQEAELTHKQALVNLEIAKAQRMAEINSTEFAQKVQAIGADTLRAMAQAGPEMQARLLEALGIQSVLITDGKNPINLFGTASGLISPINSGSEK
ncbi:MULTISPECIES: colicin uptake protein [Planktothricoides]|uniref:Colicin uptake protein n=1 Tax=Planktothricoides raciborskii FACHB-1370 TaxID=2949576 RepID=A0ABR8EKS4_9CYAN|nr:MULTISPECIES: colicin uptake protein [Planktothricoides]KOR34022.1 colicin uptake protein [Planktothricoides sp. SR001]MBD2547504.1 colicin uptake protein [Planktothricoides raciborskii FACHB-1370]MBD2586013.1 colicin uptake protein [Planktothricoides raciborskii FACHB-1261]